MAKAKKAISDYRKAIGLPAGVAELSMRERGSECGMEDEGYFAALVRMCDQALAVVAELNPSEPENAPPPDRRRALSYRCSRLAGKDAMDELWAEHVWED